MQSLMSFYHARHKIRESLSKLSHFTMATSRPTRARIPVKRYGFDHSSEDESDNDIDPLGLHQFPDNVAELDNSSTSSDEDCNAIDEAGVASDWITVEPNDPIDLEIIPFLSSEQWRYPSDMDLYDYICKFLPDSLFESLCTWTNRRANIYNATMSSEGKDEMRDYLDLGFYIGITGWLCDERRGQELQEALRYLPLDRLLFETDAPYLLPRTIRPRPKSNMNSAANLPWVLKTAEEITGVSAEELAEISTQNCHTLFTLDR